MSGEEPDRLLDGLVEILGKRELEAREALEQISALVAETLMTRAFILTARNGVENRHA